MILMIIYIPGYSNNKVNNSAIGVEHQMTENIEPLILGI